MRGRTQSCYLWFLSLVAIIAVSACTNITQQDEAPSPSSAAPASAEKPLLPRALSEKIDIALPTPNQFLFVPGREHEFYQPIEPGRPDSGKYGRVRGGKAPEESTRFHEGIDIRCLQRDKHGEPTDPVMAIADGTVAYINPLAGASNYGIYIVLKHRWSDAELYSLYAHLGSVRPDIEIGVPVKKGQTLGVMGRTSTDFKGGVPKERAHLHLEICVLANPYFPIWAQRRNNKPIEHGVFNGNNLIGLDPAAFFLAARNDPELTVRKFLDAQTPAFTVLFNAARPFPLRDQNPWLMSSPKAVPGVAALQVTFDCSGFPLRIDVRTRDEISESQRNGLLRRGWLLSGVNEAELLRRGGRDLVRKSGNSWSLTAKGEELMELLSFSP